MMHFYYIMNFSSIDIFCHVVDNFGDVGVAFRFAKELKNALPQCGIRLFVDDLEALRCILPVIDPSAPVQDHDNICYGDMRKLDETNVRKLGTAHVLVETFACYIPEAVLDAASRHKTYIINVDHLSAETWVEGYHLRESLMGRGGLKKYFFMPGFTRETGGVIIGSNNGKNRLESRLARINELLQSCHVKLDSPAEPLVATIFTYERRFDALLDALIQYSKPAYLLTFGEKSVQGMLQSLDGKNIERLTSTHYRIGNVHVVILPFLPQDDYDELLFRVDFNLVRGEDSFVRAILAEKPFIWHAYKQDKNYQQVKVRAFLDAFRPYHEDQDVFRRYYDMLLQFNDGALGQLTGERYDEFLKNLNKIGHSTAEMSYFIRNNCNLISKFIGFLNQLP